MDFQGLLEALLSIDAYVLIVWVQVENYLSHNRGVDFFYEVSTLCMTNIHYYYCYYYNC